MSMPVILCQRQKKRSEGKRKSREEKQERGNTECPKVTLSRKKGYDRGQVGGEKRKSRFCRFVNKGNWWKSWCCQVLTAKMIIQMAHADTYSPFLHLDLVYLPLSGFLSTWLIFNPLIYPLTPLDISVATGANLHPDRHQSTFSSIYSWKICRMNCVSQHGCCGIWHSPNGVSMLGKKDTQAR